MTEAHLPEVAGASFVLVGSFNPRIFHPGWFVRNALLPEGTETTANVEIVNNDFCAFETDWFRLEVLSERLTLRSLAVPAIETLRDLMLGSLRILRHTPVRKLGLNTHSHYRLPDEAAWHAFGHRLAPKERLWAPILDNPGTLVLLVEGSRPDSYEGHVRVKVEPSPRVQYGIFIDTNDEYRRAESDSAEWVEKVLVEEWEASRERAQAICAHLVQQAVGETSRG
jgi:hypothetical protein